jgi:hypothetical protein
LQDVVFNKLSVMRPPGNDVVEPVNVGTPSSKSNALSSLLGASYDSQSDGVATHNQEEELINFELRKYVREPLCSMECSPLLW